MARQFVKMLLTVIGSDSGDALLVLTELAANAVRHTYSGLPGGHIRVRVVRLNAGLIRVEVLDDGSQSLPTLRDASLSDACGRGLRLVEELASEWGWRHFGGQRCAVWALMNASALHGQKGENGDV
ncbi:ATP-binding protein [Nonomuraea guangzhouensis]|uniref:ATP-binding protein n=1 Tax=Nonomuraea guangzhouensis TaxID=1291555 RepID=A0ABW4GJ95_9ACTN|nr:ATP-binding protein [Nonomuraea guangzhouensis]